MQPPSRTTRSQQHQQQNNPTLQTTKDGCGMTACSSPNASVLEEWFKDNPKPTRREQREIATRLGITQREIDRWVKEKRASLAQNPAENDMGQASLCEARIVIPRKTLAVITNEQNGRGASGAQNSRVVSLMKIGRNNRRNENDLGTSNGSVISTSELYNCLPSSTPTNADTGEGAASNAAEGLAMVIERSESLRKRKKLDWACRKESKRRRTGAARSPNEDDHQQRRERPFLPNLMLLSLVALVGGDHAATGSFSIEHSCDILAGALSLWAFKHSYRLGNPSDAIS